MEIYNKEDTRKPEISGYIITHPSGYGSDTIPPECHDRGDCSFCTSIVPYENPDFLDFKPFS